MDGLWYLDVEHEGRTSSSDEEVPVGAQLHERLAGTPTLDEVLVVSPFNAAVVVVANPRLFEPECSSPRQMKLANALCRYRELGRPVAEA